jgi:hypothetical protein
LAETHHIACISRDQLTILNRSASYESKSFSAVDFPDCYWERLVFLCIAVEYLLILGVQALEMLVVERVNYEILVENIIDTILLLVKIPLDILQRSRFFLFIECVVRIRE